MIPGLQVLLPRFASPSNAVQLETLLPYFDDEEGPSPAVLNAEYELWCKTTATMDPKSEILQVLQQCDATYFPNMKFLLTVLATVPVSTASVERSFSTLKRVKTFLRNAMTDERLSEMAMLSVHNQIQVDPQNVLDIMATSKTRRILL